MNLENLSTGQRVANYRKLCELLEESVCGGTAKTAQLRKWKKYFSFERDKNAYIITEIYQIPQATDDKRMKYAQYLKPILLNYLALYGKTKLTFDRWYVTLGMISESLLNEDHKKEIQDTYNLSPFIIQKLIYAALGVCKRNFISTLSILAKEQLIAYEENEYIVVNFTGRCATKEEQQQIEECKSQVLHKIGATSMFEVHINPTRVKRFYDELHKLYHEKYGWDRTYTLLEINPIQAEVKKYQKLDVTTMKKNLSADIKKSVAAALFSESETANKHMLEEWENDAITKKFRLDCMTAGLLAHIITDEM